VASKAVGVVLYCPTTIGFSSSRSSRATIQSTLLLQRTVNFSVLELVAEFPVESLPVLAHAIGIDLNSGSRAGEPLASIFGRKPTTIVRPSIFGVPFHGYGIGQNLNSVPAIEATPQLPFEALLYSY